MWCLIEQSRGFFFVRGLLVKNVLPALQSNTAFPPLLQRNLTDFSFYWIILVKLQKQKSKFQNFANNFKSIFCLPHRLIHDELETQTSSRNQKMQKSFTDLKPSGKTFKVAESESNSDSDDLYKIMGLINSFPMTYRIF